MGGKRPARGRAAVSQVAEQSLRTVIGENPDGLLVIDREGVVQLANPATERLLGGAARAHEGTRLGFPLVAGQSSEVDVTRGTTPRTVECRVAEIEWGGARALLASLRDVTDHRRAEAKLRGLLESAPDAIVIVDELGKIDVVNAMAETLFGYRREDLLGRPFEVLVPERSCERRCAGFFGQAGASATSAGLELRARRRDGTEFPVDLSFGPLKTADGTFVTAVIRDATERVRGETTARVVAARFRRAFDEAPIGLAMLDLGGRFVQVNRALCAITGYTCEQLEATSLHAITHPADVGQAQLELASALVVGRDGQRSERRLVRADQRSVWVATGLTLLRDVEDRPQRLLALIQDIDDRRRYEGRLRYLADHDPLTSLLNRRSFEQELESQVALAERYGGGGAVVVLDLDYFKLINDTLGHDAGDTAIIRTAQVLRSRLRETDVLARFGGDEFAVLLPRADTAKARVVAEELIQALRRETVELSGVARPLAASAGIAMFKSQTSSSGSDVLANADMAMFDAKHAGRDRVSVSAAGEPSVSQTKARVTWAQRIENALERDGFTLLAQPIVDLVTGQANQYELLLRMRDERGELVMPSAFLDTAERLGMVQQIDRWVAERAITLLAQRGAHGGELTFEVNVSGSSMGDPELLVLIHNELDRTKVPPRRLVIDVAETAVAINTTRAEQFARGLAQLGCRLALDDFGAGYGSFYYLKHLPFDFIKIDGEFVSACCTNETDRLLITAIVEVVNGLGKRTIAELVGDDDTARVLQRLGVDYGQGFHLGRPARLNGSARAAPRNDDAPAAR